MSATLPPATAEAAEAAAAAAAAAAAWHAGSKRHLVDALAQVRRHLQRHADPAAAAPDAAGPVASGGPGDAETTPAADSTLARLCRALRLTPFERDVLLLCAGMEMDATFASLCAAAQGDARRAYPTFGLALAALPGAHWSALTPDAPLRRWRLVEMDGPGLTAAPLRVDERVLHHLAGVDHLDERLARHVTPLPDAGPLAGSHDALATRLAATWTALRDADAVPLAQVVGPDADARRAVAAAACRRVGLTPCLAPLDALPAAPQELETFLRAWERECVLSGTALLLDAERDDGHDHARAAALARLVEEVRGVVVLLSRERRPVRARPTLVLEVAPATPAEQADLWAAHLDEDAARVEARVAEVSALFRLGGSAIRAACAEARGRAAAGEGALGEALWDAARAQARPRLEDLAQRIEPVAGWDDLVLPPLQKEVLREVCAHVRHRAKVHDEWGFGGQGARGLGTSALFAGDSGTGKTMAAEVLAKELRLDLYRIDLSQVVSKYIGETEKNLRRVFDAADEGGAILLFDEADALFGKRSDVKDSHDRYANIEVSYLLQRMEQYRGLAILTTNLRESLDPAFLRRIRFVVQFPFPDPEAREDIWRRAFPRGAPTEGIDPARLAQLAVAGGNIRNIAISAAFLAADAGGPVRMEHLLRAARAEYAKLEKHLSEVDLRGWPA